MDLFKQNSSAREDLGMLAVMDALEDEAQVTQRELSRKTGLNLKKVNYCLHKLLEKGYVKFQQAMDNPDKRIYLYILTPQGLKAKSNLTYRFLKLTLAFYNQVEEKLERCLREMEQAGVRRMVLCGASEAAKIVNNKVSGGEIQIIGVLDEACSESEFAGLPLLKPDDLSHMAWDGVLVTALDDLDEVDSRLEAMTIPKEKVWHLQ